MLEALWWITSDGDERVREVYDRHYSAYVYKDGRKPKKCIGPGFYRLLRTWDCDAIFAWRKFRDACEGQTGINCSVFRNEAPQKFRSSELVRQADAVADRQWPRERHYTYVDADKVSSTNPGYCFILAGWRRCGFTKGGLIILEKLWDWPPYQIKRRQI